MWGWSNQQRHARDASRNIALTMFFAGGLGPYFWIAFLVFIGWLNGWFSGVGFSLQASKPAHTSADYQVRGIERIKNPFTWDEGVEDIRTAIRLETNKQYLSTGYSALAEAYARKGEKDKALQYLQTALKFDQEYEAEAKNEVERNMGHISGEIKKIFIQRYVQNGYKRWW